MVATLPINLYAASLRSDAMNLMQRVGFDDRFGRKRLSDLIHEYYIVEMWVPLQLVRWYKIGLIRPNEMDVPHPAVLMIDLRGRIAASPQNYVASAVMDRTIERMFAWWRENTITTSWRSVEAHVQVATPTDGLCDALADFLWEVQDALVAKASDVSRSGRAPT